VNQIVLPLGIAVPLKFAEIEEAAQVPPVLEDITL
jgi:hypothetical protein